MFDEKKTENVSFSFNLNLLFFCLNFFCILFREKIRISNYIQKKKQNSLVVVFFVSTFTNKKNKQHKVSSKLCCAMEKKLIREVKSKTTPNVFLSIGEYFSLTCRNEGEQNKTKGITRRRRRVEKKDSNEF